MKIGLIRIVNFYQGTKIVIQNLQTSVTQEDILELFGDIGALRRAKVSSQETVKQFYSNYGAFVASESRPCRSNFC